MALVDTGVCCGKKLRLISRKFTNEGVIISQGLIRDLELGREEWETGLSKLTIAPAGFIFRSLSAYQEFKYLSEV